MQEPTRPEFGEGRSWWKSYERIKFHQTCRGISDGMQAMGTIRNTGGPSGDRSVDQLAARERKAGPFGMAERLVLPMKLKADARSDDGKGDWR
jgi:hypothetical protein